MGEKRDNSKQRSDNGRRRAARHAPAAGRRKAGPTKKNAAYWLAGVGDNPVGEGVPEGGFAEGKADLLDEN